MEGRRGVATCLCPSSVWTQMPGMPCKPCPQPLQPSCPHLVPRLSAPSCCLRGAPLLPFPCKPCLEPLQPSRPHFVPRLSKPARNFHVCCCCSHHGGGCSVSLGVQINATLIAMGCCGHCKFVKYHCRLLLTVCQVPLGFQDVRHHVKVRHGIHTSGGCTPCHEIEQGLLKGVAGKLTSTCCNGTVRVSCLTQTAPLLRLQAATWLPRQPTKLAPVQSPAHKNARNASFIKQTCIRDDGRGVCSGRRIACILSTLLGRSRPDRSSNMALWTRNEVASDVCNRSLQGA